MPSEKVEKGSDGGAKRGGAVRAGAKGGDGAREKQGRQRLSWREKSEERGAARLENG